MSYERGSYRKHEELKARILTDPSLVGINKRDIISMETEYTLTRRRRSVVAQPDIVITYRHGNKVRKQFIEIKSGSCRRAKHNLQKQLRKVSNCLKRHHIQGDVLGVYPTGNVLQFLAL